MASNFIFKSYEAKRLSVQETEHYLSVQRVGGGSTE